MRRICVILNTRGHWARCRDLLTCIDQHPDLELKIICAGSMVLRRFKRPVDDVRKHFHVEAEIYHEVEGSMAHSIGSAVTSFATELRRLSPDFTVVIGDRFEALAAAVAATYSETCLVHIQGGEISGTLDEFARHAITKLAHYHVPATAGAYANLRRMGEQGQTILTVGCPGSDLCHDVFAEMCGGGLTWPWVLILHHPDTVHPGTESGEIDSILTAVSRLKRPAVLFWSNIDDRHDLLQKAVRQWRDRNPDALDLRTETQWPPLQFLYALACCPLAVGNSSAFVRDSSFFGTPVVLVGQRQAYREHGENVVEVDADAGEILEACRGQLNHGRYAPSDLYGDGQVSDRIADALASVAPYRQKVLSYAVSHQYVEAAWPSPARKAA